MTHRPQIVIENAMARVLAPPETIRALRPLVAYQAGDYPPVPVQRIIRQFMAYQPRSGAANEIALLYALRGAELEAAGWPKERLTVAAYTQVLRARGEHDGWTTLITPDGFFPSGLASYVERALQLRMRVGYDLIDNRRRPPPGRQIGTRPVLYPFQAEAVAAWLRAGRGVVDLPPRSGKTRIAAAAIQELGLPALIVVPTVALVDQTVEALQPFFPVDQVIGITGGTPNAKWQRRLNNAMVWVSTPQTAAGGRGKQGIPGIASRQVLVIDEFHHAAAATWHTISQAARNAFYRMGLTGTHFRSDGKDLAMHGVLSRCVFRRSVVHMVGAGRLAPAIVAMVRLPATGFDAGSGRLYRSGIVDMDPRNEVLAWAAHTLLHAGKRVLVIVKEVAHAEALAAMIPGAVGVDGRDNTRVRPALKALEAGQISCVVGTSVIGEGIDVPAADALIYGAGGKSRVKVVQDFFRVLTAHPGKSRGIVIDCADNHHDRLIVSAAHRLAAYREEFQADVVEYDAFPGWLQATLRT